MAHLLHLDAVVPDGFEAALSLKSETMAARNDHRARTRPVPPARSLKPRTAPIPASVLTGVRLEPESGAGHYRDVVAEALSAIAAEQIRDEMDDLFGAL